MRQFSPVMETGIGRGIVVRIEMGGCNREDKQRMNRQMVMLVMSSTLLLLLRP